MNAPGGLRGIIVPGGGTPAWLWWPFGKQRSVATRAAVGASPTGPARSRLGGHEKSVMDEIERLRAEVQRQGIITLRHPVTQQDVEVDTRTGRIVGRKDAPVPSANRS